MAEKLTLAEPPAEVSLDGLYRQHWREVRAYVRRCFGPGPPDPDDIAQDAFVRLISSDKPHGASSNPRAQLIAIARNLAIDAYRRNHVGRAVARSVGLLGPDIDRVDAAQALASKEEVQKLEETLATLTPKERSAFLMHRLDGLSFSEIARRMGISPSGARFLVARALAACVAGLAEGAP